MKYVLFISLFLLASCNVFDFTNRLRLRLPPQSSSSSRVPPTISGNYSLVDGMQVSVGNSSVTGNNYSANVNVSWVAGNVSGTDFSADIQFNTVDAR